MPKPKHLTWEEAASPGLVNCTAYRQLVSKNGGDMKQGDNVLIWGASGGLGGFATQYALNGGATPVCVVSNEEKADDRPLDGRGADRSTAPRRATSSGRTSTPRTRRSGSASAARSVSSPAVRTSTSSSSTRAARPSAPASTSPARAAPSPPAPRRRGYMHEYDNRYLWMNLKRIISSHFANYRESWEANRLRRQGQDPPHSLADLQPRRGRARPLSTSTRTCTRARSASSASPPEEGLGVRHEPTDRSAGASSTDRIGGRQTGDRSVGCGTTRHVPTHLRPPETPGAQCSRSSTPSWPATPPREDFAAPRAARVLPRRDGAQGRGRHVRGHGRAATRTRASRCTSRTSRCPSSVRVRRSSR